MAITIVGLGPGRVEDMTLAAWRCLDQADAVYLRTKRHPLLDDLPPNTVYYSFDELYDEADTFATVYTGIAERIVQLGRDTGKVIYAVPGHPMVGEKTTDLILQKAAEHNVEVNIIGGLSFIEPSLEALQIDGMAGLQIVDALDMTELYHPLFNPDFPTLIAQVYSREIASAIKLMLMNQYPDEYEVILLHGAGTTDVIKETVPLYEIDRSDHIAHLTTLFVPALSSAGSFAALQNVMAHLRSDQGCPWDQKQTHESLRPHFLEEVYEVLEAIDNGDMDSLREELGDVLFHLMMQAQIATEGGDFYATEVLQGTIEKLIRRHPHVWGDVDAEDAKTVVQNWEAIKQQEQAEKAAEGDVARESILDGVPLAVPALVMALRLQERAAGVGFDWPDVAPVIDKVFEEIDEIKADPSSAEFGDLLFAVVNWARWQDIDPEGALREANQRFKRRFLFIEQRVQKQGAQLVDLSLEVLDRYWNEAKQAGL